MKRAKIISGIICLVFDIVICIMVCHQWALQGCGFWSLFAAIVFYTVGCLGLWILIDQIIDAVYRYDDDEYYGPYDD